MPCFSFLKRKKKEEKSESEIGGELSDDGYEFRHRKKTCACICMKCCCYDTVNYSADDYPIPNEDKQHYL